MYDTDYERREAQLESKRKWRRKNRRQLAAYMRKYREKKKAEASLKKEERDENGLLVLPAKISTEFRKAHAEEIRKELEMVGSQRKVAERWQCHRRTLMRTIGE